MLSKLLGVVALASALVACSPPVSKAVLGTLPVERGAECRANCAALGMQLTSVVLIMNSTGCVCQVLDAPAPAPGTPPSTSASASAIVGGAAIAITAAAAQAEARRDTPPHSRQPSHTPPSATHR